MHAAEDYVIGFGTSRNFTGQEKRVALEVGVLDNLFPLIMMTQDGNCAAEFPTSFTNLQVQFRGSVVQVFRGNLLPPHIEGHLFGQGFGKEFVFGLAECRVLDLGGRHYGPTAC